MPSTAEINAEISRRHEQRWDACLSRSERAVRTVRSVVVSAWDQLGVAIRQGVKQGWTYRRARAEAAAAVNAVVPRLIRVFDKSLSAQTSWAHESAVDALYAPLPDDAKSLAESVLWEAARPRVGLRGMRRILPPPSEEEVRKILTARVNGMTWRQRLETLSHQIDDKNGVVDRIATGIAAGRTPKEIRDSIQPLVNGLQTSATRIIRTEMRRVANQMSEGVWARSLRVIVAFRRRSQRDGKVRPEHVIKDGLRYLVGQPRPSLPDAPNCRCYYVPEYGEK